MCKKSMKTPLPLIMGHHSITQNPKKSYFGRMLSFKYLPAEDKVFINCVGGKRQGTFDEIINDFLDCRIELLIKSKEFYDNFPKNRGNKNDITTICFDYRADYDVVYFHLKDESVIECGIDYIADYLKKVLSLHENVNFILDRLNEMGEKKMKSTEVTVEGFKLNPSKKEFLVMFNILTANYKSLEEAINHLSLCEQDETVDLIKKAVKVLTDRSEEFSEAFWSNATPHMFHLMGLDTEHVYSFEIPKPKIKTRFLISTMAGHGAVHFVKNDEDLALTADRLIQQKWSEAGFNERVEILDIHVDESIAKHISHMGQVRDVTLWNFPKMNE